MMRCGTFALLIVVAAADAKHSAGSKHAAAAKAQQGVTPVQKVLTMLNDMLAKGKAEKQGEQKAFAKYEDFVRLTHEEKAYQIKKGKEHADQLEADIDKASADVLTATKQIAAHDQDIATWDTDLADAKKVRADAHAVYTETHKDYTEAIDAVDRALRTLRAGPKTGLAQTSLMQLSSNHLVPSEAKKKFMAFLQAPENALLQDAELMENEDKAPPQAKVESYQSSSGGVIEMVDQLGEKFGNERVALEKAEANAVHSYQMFAKDLTNQKDAATEERDAKTAFKAQQEQAKSEAQGDLDDTEATIAADEKFAKDLTAEHAQKVNDFSKRQILRHGEIEALEQAIEIMDSESVSGSANKHLPALIQKKKVSLAQLRSRSHSSGQADAAAFLQQQGRKLNNQMLSMLSEKVSADPFKKVVKMIQDMIEKLTQEAADEAEHKGFCDSELASNKQTRDTKTEESETLKANIEELTADIQKLGQEITDLASAISEIDSQVAQATSDREAEHEKNTATIADAEAGAKAVAAATQVLKEFYEKAAISTSFTQVHTKAKVPGAPETFTKPYTGQESGGALGMLEVCQSDFERLLADTTAGEAEAKDVFEKFMADSTEDKDTKTTDMKDKTNTKTEKESALATANKDLVSVTSELDAAKEYFEKLKPSCLAPGETYEERVARRNNEIESLKEALRILEGESV